MPDRDVRQLLHASALSIAGAGVLLRGAAGSGKSDLALRLMDRGHRLIADDQVVLERAREAVLLSAPGELSGLMEVRGIGILRVTDTAQAVPLRAVIDLEDADDIERIPPLEEVIQVMGLRIARFHLDPHAASAPVRVEVMVDLVEGRRLRHA